MKVKFINGKYCLSIVCLVLSLQVQAEEDELIYQDYQFTPVYSEQDDSLNAAVAEPFEARYSNEWMATNIKDSIEIDGTIFAVGHVGFREGKSGEYNVLKRKERKQGHDITKLKEKIQNNSLHILFSLNEGTLDELVKETRNQRFYSSGHGAFDYLYCVEDQPLFSAPLFRNKPFLFHITATGHFTNLGIGNDHIKFGIFSPESGGSLLSIPLLLSNYAALSPDDDNRTKYQFIAYDSESTPDGGISSKKGEGRKRYAKLFIQDFDKNNKLDIVVWHREYASARRDDETRKGFYLDKEWFEWHEENASSDGLIKRELPVKAGHQLLKDNEVWWKDGWPNENRCDTSWSNLPYMMYIKDLEIDEPMGKTLGFGY